MAYLGWVCYFSERSGAVADISVCVRVYTQSIIITWLEVVFVVVLVVVFVVLVE